MFVHAAPRRASHKRHSPYLLYNQVKVRSMRITDWCLDSCSHQCQYKPRLCKTAKSMAFLALDPARRPFLPFELQPRLC